MLYARLIIFFFVSGLILYVSRDSLKNPRAHGFYRFFAFEGILVHFLLNMTHWFRDPFSPAQILSWIFLFVSTFLVIHGAYLLKKIGQPPRGEIENTAVLVTLGAYRYIRHPLYSSLLFLSWGVFCKRPFWWPGAALAAAIFVFLYATARVEEAENAQKFGDVYTEYMKRSRMFVPWLF